MSRSAHHPDVPTFFVELCELVSDDAPSFSHRRTNSKEFDCRHWRERYRWIDFEEAYDPSVGEFSPPKSPVFRFDHASRLRKQLKSDLILEDVEGDHIDKVLSRIAKDYVSLANDTGKSCLLSPVIHPEVESSEHSVFRRGVLKHPEYPTNAKLSKCLADDSKSAIVFAGHAPRIAQPVLLLARLKTPVPPTGVVEVPYPVQFVILSLTPTIRDTNKAVESARILGSFMTNKRFRVTCSRASSSDEILTAADNILSRSSVETKHMKQGRERTESELTYWSELFSEEEEERKSRKAKRLEEQDEEGNEKDGSEEKSDEDNDWDGEFEADEGCCARMGHSIVRRLWPPGRDLVQGLVQVAKRYPSDFADALNKNNISVCMSSILFIYFVVFAPSITFGTLMHRQVDPAFSVSNSILASGFTTLLYAMFAGQPTAIIGPSGPGFIIERLVAEEATSFGVEFFTFRFWVLLYTCIFGAVFILLNLSNIAMRARRSMEELFSAFISGFLLIKALFSIFTPIPMALPPKGVNLTASENERMYKAAVCGANAFIATLMMIFCLCVVKFKMSKLIRRKVRFWIGAMNVPIAICLMIAVERIWFAAYQVDRLQVPPVAQINYTSWFNIPKWNKLMDYGPSSASAVQGKAILYGFILAFLIFVEIALNSIVALRGKSIKPSPIAIDHVFTNIVFPGMAMVLGLPLVSGVPIRTIANMMALVKVNPNPAPGGQGAVWYLVEQRVNTIIVGILVTISVFLGDILHFIPVASLFGLFLFLGIFGLRGLRYKQILTALLSRKKYWSQWNILDGLPRKIVYAFTGIWMLELVILLTLLILGEFDAYVVAGTIIPFVLVLCGVIREFVLPKWKFMAPYLEKMDPPCAPAYYAALHQKKRSLDDDTEASA